MRHRVRRFIDSKGLVPTSGPLVVGVSGGPDSVCLLHLLVQLRDEIGLDLHVAHLNHQLRDAESDGDAAYVSDLSESMGIPATVAIQDVQAYRYQKRISLEEAAREVRYDFFSEVAQSIGTECVAVGHTLDDQAETILMHLIRGGGLSGLCGMRPISHWQLASESPLTVIRPLLEVSREETQAYCTVYDLFPRKDSSNASDEYLRNRIRRELVPLLERYNPNIQQGLARLGSSLQGDSDYLSIETSRLWGSVADDCPEGISIDNRAFVELPLSLKRHLLRSVWQRVAGSVQDIEQIHIESMINLLEMPAGKQLSLPDGLHLLGGYDRSLITREENISCSLPTLEGEYQFAVPGETFISDWRITARVVENRDELFEEDRYGATFDFELVGEQLTLRTRKDGDRFQPLGMNHSKKLQDYMVDARIPRGWRDRVPLVCARGQIIWVVGWRIDERAKVRSTTKRVLRLEFRMTGSP